MVDELRLRGSRRCRQMGSHPSDGWRSNMAATLQRTTPFSQRAEPLAVVVGDAGWRNRLRVWSRRPAAQEPGLRRYGPRRLGPPHRELLADTRIQWRQWNARRLRKVPPVPETRSDCAWVTTTSHSARRPVDRLHARRLLFRQVRACFHGRPIRSTGIRCRL